jgi:hypothetical protein
MAGSMTDVVGYRNDSMADGGALMRAVAPQLEHVLTGKSPLLNGPGMVMENSLYYDITSSTVTAVELQETFQKDRIACSVMQAGSSTTCYIPSVLFANTCYLVMTLPYDDSNVVWKSIENSEFKTDHYFYMPDGWGFYYLRNVIVYLGACSIAQIEISGESNMLVAMAQCETKSKRQNVLSHAGRYLNSLDQRSVLAQATPGKPIFRYRNRGMVANNLMYSATLDNSVTKLTTTDAYYPPLATAMIPIRLPFSSLCALDKRISFDTKLLTQPIQLTFGIKDQREVIKTNVPGIAESLGRFKSLTVQLWQQELSDKSLSLRNELLRAPDFNIGYPFQYIQSVSFQVPAIANGGSPWGPSDFILMNITSLINSDLTTMLFYVNGNYQRNATNAKAYNKPISITSGTPPTTYTNVIYEQKYNGADYCPLYGVQLMNLELKLNGQRFYAFDYDTYSAATMAKQIDNESFTVQRPQIGQLKSLLADNNEASNIPCIAQFPTSAPTGAVLPEMQSYIINSNYYELNFGKLRSIVLEAHMQNTGRFTNQTFQLSFQINDIWACQQQDGFDQNTVLGYTGQSNSGQIAPYTLYMTYLYNAVLLAGGDGGSTKLITN